jgi:phosphate:Na+ symporter
MFLKNKKKNDIGLILLGFATLIYGMEAMSAAVKPLSQMEGFADLFLLFSNPILGVLVGAIVTGIIQTSSGSVGILQALSTTGQISIGATIPIIMGQNIGTCVTALISSVGTNKNARRAAIVHLYFNLVGTVFYLSLFAILNRVFSFAFVNQAANPFTIAIIHTIFNLACTALLLPFSELLEKLAYRTIPDDNEKEKVLLLDARLFSTPSIALNRSREIAKEMADTSVKALKMSFGLIDDYNEKVAEKVSALEDQTDIYEDSLGTYLVKLSSQNLSSRDSTEAAKILFLIGEFERIADYASNITKSAQEIYEKKLVFSDQAKNELAVMLSAVEEIVKLAVNSFKENNLILAAKVDPLEEVIDELKSAIKKQHVGRLQSNECTIELGFVFSDLLTVLERISDHSSNIAGCVIEMSHDSMNMHDYLHTVKYERNTEFKELFSEYSKKYTLPKLNGV